jgi:ASC-1-like (ASCH) protein
VGRFFTADENKSQAMERGVREPWFSLIATGAKRYEGRLGNNRAFADAAIGTCITWVNSELGFKRQCKTSVVKVVRYKSFRAMFRSVGLRNVLPTVERTEDGEAVYRGFYPAADEAAHGVVCVELRPVTPSPRRAASSRASKPSGPSGPVTATLKRPVHRKL